MALEDLSPGSLERLLGSLDLSKALILDVLRGRSISEEEVNQVRKSIHSVRKTLNSLDEKKPWNSDWTSGAVHGQFPD